MPADPPESTAHASEDPESLGEQVYSEYERRMRAELAESEAESPLRDELELPLAREAALNAERAARLQAKPENDGPAGAPRATRQGPLDWVNLRAGRMAGAHYNVAMVFITYPIAGALLGWLIDHYFLNRWIPDSNWALLVCLIAGFYNGIIEVQRLMRRIQADEAAAKRERR